MKKAYVKPVLELEMYTLNADIAGNCGNKVTLGPGIVQSNGQIQSICDEFNDPWAMALSVDTSFYDENTGSACTCYYSAGGEGYFTS